MKGKDFFKKWHWLLAVAIVAAGFWLTPFTSQAKMTIPVMVDYFSTASFGSNGPVAITYMQDKKEYAIADLDDKLIYIVSLTGILKDKIDISSYFEKIHGVAYVGNKEQFAVVSYLYKKIFIVEKNGNLVKEINIPFVSKPMSICYLKEKKQFVVADYYSKIFFIDIDGLLVDQLDISAFGCSVPTGITYNPDDSCFAVCEYNTQNIFLFDDAGNLNDKFNAKFLTSNIYGIAYNQDTKNYDVVDYNNSNFFSINDQGYYAGAISTDVYGSASPHDITYLSNTDEWAFIDNSAKKIFIISPSGILQNEIDVSSFCSNPTGLVYMGASNTFAVLDYVLKKIFLVSTAGALIEQLNINVFGLSSYAPYHIELDTSSNQLLFSDINGYAVSFLEAINPVKLKKQLSTSAAGCTKPVGIGYVPENQTLLITDNVKDEVFVIDQYGSLKARFDSAGVLYSNEPLGIAYDPNNQIFALVDWEDHRINLLKLPALTKSVNRCEGDFDQDGDVDGMDLSTFAADFGRTDCP